ncbi:hypothetical protein [Methylocapsa sp. S129]|uniref:hypothetical protein n=1 Tax=Methylocapsa sp. S129 TaxID=1641869 RepID=UPI00131C58E6|nr:hypothetical protein [Methylocapsa sp. S129]
MWDRKRTLALHAAAGAAAFLIIASFQTATIVAEIAAIPALIAAVKTSIVFGLLVLIPMMAIAGATGRRLAGPSPKGLAARKLRRLVLAALNGICVLVPCALFLAWEARAGMFDAWFLAVQALELAAGLANLILIGLNMRDGFAMSGRFGRRPNVSSSPRRT